MQFVKLLLFDLLCFLVDDFDECADDLFDFMHPLE